MRTTESFRIYPNFVPKVSIFEPNHFHPFLSESWPPKAGPCILRMASFGSNTLCPGDRQHLLSFGLTVDWRNPKTTTWDVCDKLEVWRMISRIRSDLNHLPAIRLFWGGFGGSLSCKNPQVKGSTMSCLWGDSPTPPEFVGAFQWRDLTMRFTQSWWLVWSVLASSQA